MTKQKHVTDVQIREVMHGLQGMALSLEDCLQRLSEKGIEEVPSDNYWTCLNSLVHVLKFVDGVAGSATTAEHRDLIGPVMESREQYKKNAD